ncbi:Arylsulfatase [Cordylochernes scorpioides]|uniref:Arylsulfatase n=1 Tax=Cordylochernes scorpioides TaxID=51811 RepID=A0ABY6L493_9ARAC|nr:Arylsulfatase [Cordylochernes scorpioides]
MCVGVQGWNDVSFHGSPQIETPNIDKLADLGITLNNYYVQPICTPSRGALMSGQYPIHTGLQHDVIAHGQPWGLPLQISILPQHLKDLGYATHAVGKWHLGFFHPDYTPTKRGFDSHYGYWCGAEDYVTHVAREPDLTPRAAQPLFLYVAYQSVHSSQGSAPLQAPPKYVDRFPHIQDPKRRMFAGMVAAMDDSIGAILEALHSRGLLDNAVVAFSTDNGGPAGGFNLNQASNWPLRGVKYSLWEGGTRGSALVWSPLLSNQGHKSSQLMHVTDWLPTLYSAAGGCGHPLILQQMLLRLSQYEKIQMQPLFRPDDPKAAPKFHNFVWSPWKDDPLL